MPRMLSAAAGALLLLAVPSLAADPNPATATGPTTAPAAPALANDYPTEARVDYVLGCMATNGKSHEAVRKCSCSIDVIASQISYEDYTSVETAMALAQMPGERAGALRDVNWVKDLMDRFRQAQLDADLECFSRDHAAR
ncbi:hypothetical protein [Aerophototrophica crusticola]|uniref:hypothetical protein n=1 Tax=Aerophototrophica crusticola TaxID=1709002 RepID=UPI000952B66A